MGKLTKILVVLLFAGLGVTAYAASVMGWGVGDIRNAKTMREIQQKCPDYYKNRNGDCLRTTFRSYYLIRGVQGGGPGRGK